MKIVRSLISHGLRHVIGDVADKAVEMVIERFTDESEALPKAVAAANERAWHALNVALAGDSLWEQFKRYAFADATQRALRQQIEMVLRAIAATSDTQLEPFRKACLNDLSRLRKSDAFKTSHLPVAELKRQTTAWKRYTDPKGVIDGAWDAVAGVAAALANGYPNLSCLLRERAGDGPPLLAALFSFFLRQEIVKNKDLSAALTFDLIGNLFAAQETAFIEVWQALATVGDKIDAILGQLDRIEGVVVETQAILLDIQAELQRHHGDDVRLLLVQVIERLDKQGTQRGVLGPGDSSRMQSDEERAAVRALKQRFRQLPPELQRQVPALLNGLGKLEHIAGDFAEARTTFAAAARIAPGDAARAEVFFNAYRSALELRDYDGAFSASQQAAVLDPVRFALFPAERYAPQRILGAGGFGAAFLCQDENFERLVVVKTLHTHDQLERAVTTVFNEAVALSGLSHPALIKVYDGDFAFKDAARKRKERPYIVMEYFPGVSLKTYVERHGELKPHEFLAVAKQIVSAMIAAHQHGYLQRDLKPDNILILRDGNRFVVKIIDFGLALRLSVVETSAAQKGERTLMGDTATGTRRYAAPEQMDPHLGIKVGWHSDVYSFGMMGRFCLHKTTMPRAAQKQSAPEMAALLDKCTQGHPDDRYPNFQAVLAQLSPPQPLPSIRVETVHPNPVTLDRGSSSTLTVRVLRENFGEELNVDVEDLPQSVHLDHSSGIGIGGVEARINLTADREAVPGTQHARIVVWGTGVRADATLTVIVNSGNNPPDSTNVDGISERTAPKSDIKSLQEDFWSALPLFEGERSPDARDHRAKFPRLRGGKKVSDTCFLEAQIVVRKGEIRVALLIWHPVSEEKRNDRQNVNHQEWERLRNEHEAEIQQKCGPGVYWHKPKKRDQENRLIRLDCNDRFDLTDRASWPKAQKWLLENLGKFREVFGRLLHAPCGRAL